MRDAPVSTRGHGGRQVRTGAALALSLVVTLGACSDESDRRARGSTTVPVIGQAPDVGPTYASLAELVLRSSVIAELEVTRHRLGRFSADDRGRRRARLSEVGVIEPVEGASRGERFLVFDAVSVRQDDGTERVTNSEGSFILDVGDRVVLALTRDSTTVLVEPGAPEVLFPWSDDSAFFVDGDEIESSHDPRPVVARAEALSRDELLAELRELAG